MRSIALLAALIAAPAVAAAPARHDPAAASAKSVESTTPNVMIKNAPPNFDAMLGLMDKLFPPQPDPDPARLALARAAVAPMWPDGAYGKMMSGIFGKVYDQAMQLKESDLAAVGSPPAKPSAASANSDVSLHDKILAKDPHFDQRAAAIRAVLEDEMSKVSAILDPRMRDGLARAMARRFDAQQLTDINAFYATPSGRALAGQYMQLFIDPDTLRSVFQSMPEMMKLLPDMMQRMKEANDKFPEPAKTARTAKP